MADGSDAASFTVRLINQVTAPAKQIQAAVTAVESSMKSLQRTVNAPAPRRSPLSEWDKMVAKARLSQAKDFAAQHKKLVDAEAKSPKGQSFLGQLWDQLAPAALSGGVAGATSAALTEVIGLAKSAIAAVIDLGASFAHAALEAAAFGERSTMAIGYLTDRADIAGGVFDSVRHSAQELGLNVEGTMKSFQKLLAAQFTIGQSKALVKMGADMQAIGASGEEVQRILYAMTEIKSIGTLQKRQERMLQMAGISGKLIDEALMEKGGFKSHKEMESARKKNLIGSDLAMDAIIAAVKHKTHESELGDVGRTFANSTLTGMRQQFAAASENLFVDAGQKILPGVTEIAQLVRGTLGKLVDDPQLRDFASRMLDEFKKFVGWTVKNWPLIEQMVIVTSHAIADTITVIVRAFDEGTAEGQAFRATLDLLALPFKPIVWSVKLLAHELEYLIALFNALVGAPAKISDMFAAVRSGKSGATGLPVAANDNGKSGWGLPGLGAIPTVAAGIVNPGVTFGAGLNALLSNGITSASHPVDAKHEVNMNGMTIHVTAPEGSSPETLAQKIHSELANLLRQAS